MKKQVFSFLSVGLFIVIGMQSASAQLQLGNGAISYSSPEPVVVKPVLTSFNRLFKDAVAPEWFASNKNYVVNFIQNGQKSKAEFTRGGHLLYNILYGNEKEMPVDLRSVVKSSYYDYAINSTVKIEFQGHVCWIINLEDANSLLVLRIEDGDVEVLKHVKKG